MTGGVLVSIFEADANRALRLGWFGRALSALFGKPSPEQTGHYWPEVAEPGPLNCLEADIPTVCNGSGVRPRLIRLRATSGPSATAAGIAALRSQAVAARSGRAGRLHDLEIEATRVQARLWKVENQLDLPG